MSVTQCGSGIESKILYPLCRTGRGDQRVCNSGTEHTQSEHGSISSHCLNKEVPHPDILGHLKRKLHLCRKLKVHSLVDMGTWYFVLSCMKYELQWPILHPQNCPGHLPGSTPYWSSWCRSPSTAPALQSRKEPTRPFSFSPGHSNKEVGWGVSPLSRDGDKLSRLTEISWTF